MNEALKILDEQKNRFVGILASPIAGIREVAEAEQRGRQLFVQSMEKITLPLPVSKNGLVIVVQNRGICSGRGEVFGLDQKLGLNMVMVCIPEETDPYLTLVLSIRTPGSMGYALVSIMKDGRIHCSRYEVSFDQQTYLYALLGKVNPRNVLEYRAIFGGDPDEIIGFPGALDYITKNFDQLGPYLSEMATSLKR
ncbi:hypothetical protein HYV70_05045 [Candidatus Uhrbacteria bacterium]|nr:hypothetical protein [Candidatus Uhrbacteria bacterium]